VQRLVRLVRDVQRLPGELRVLDLCTGTGCIPLLFHHDLYAARTDVELRALGIDVSGGALRLAAHNLQRARRSPVWVGKGDAIGYLQADVLANPFADGVHSRRRLAVSTALRHARLPHLWDILISNPPYISPNNYWNTTTRSVRGFEPKLALVPPPQPGSTDAEQADAFYPPILDIASEVEAKLVLLEVADLDQALRVARAARALRIFDGVEIWRDQPDEPADPSPKTAEFPVLGRGSARSVVCWRGAGAAWLGKSGRACTYENVAFAPVSPDAYFPIDPVTRIPIGGQLRPHWVKDLNQQRKEEKRNVWRDNSTEHSREPEEGQRRKPQNLVTQLRAALKAQKSSAHRGNKKICAPQERYTTIGNTRCNEEQQNLIIQYCRDGMEVKEIADALGTDSHAVYRYLERCSHVWSQTDSPIQTLVLNEEQQKRLMQYFHDGWKMQAVADVFGCTKRTIGNYLKSRSTPDQTQNQKAVQSEDARVTGLPFNEEQRKRLIQYYRDGWRVQAIADLLGCHRATVYNYLKRSSVPPQNRNRKTGVILLEEKQDQKSH
jgi:methylase of polypeptide subunit release factors/DNA-directed RNA polymerase specialized sigma24 family protein